VENILLTAIIDVHLKIAIIYGITTLSSISIMFDLLLAGFSCVLSHWRGIYGCTRTSVYKNYPGILIGLGGSHL